MPCLGKRNARRNIFMEDQFHYDPDQDVYICPAGQHLKRKTLHPKRSSIDYGAPKKICAACELRENCTRNKTGRTVKRRLRQTELDQMRKSVDSAKSKRDIKTRQHLMERSFARAKRYGFDRARWRGLWRMHIQEYMICAIQNIQILINHGTMSKQRPAMALKQVKATISKNKWLLSTALKAQFGPFSPYSVV